MKIYAYNLDNFLNGSKNKLLVAGIVGSGKTYVGKYLKNKFGYEFNDFDDYFYANISLKKSDPDLYVKNRKSFEEQLFFSSSRAVVAGLGPILRNQNNHDLSEFPILLIDRNHVQATLMAVYRNFKSIFKRRLYGHIWNELLFPIRGNWHHVDNFRKFRAKYAQTPTHTFNSHEELVEYIEKYNSSN